MLSADMGTYGAIKKGDVVVGDLIGFLVICGLDHVGF